jgi:NADH-quinone oxidoreductase subunit J
MSLTYIFFIILGILSIASAILTIAHKHPVVSAMALVFHFFMLAGLYLTLQAQFIAVLQVLVYAGAIMVLVVFVIMLLNLGDEEKHIVKINYKKVIAVFVSFGLAIQLLTAFFTHSSGNLALSDNAIKIGTAQSIGNVLFTKYLFPFEAISLLLLVAIVGSVLLAKRKID